MGNLVRIELNHARNCERNWDSCPLPGQPIALAWRAKRVWTLPSPHPLREIPKISPLLDASCPYPLTEFPKRSPQEAHIHSAERAQVLVTPTQMALAILQVFKILFF